MSVNVLTLLWYNICCAHMYKELEILNDEIRQWKSVYI